MQRTYRVPLTRIGLIALVGVLVLFAFPGTSIAGGASQSTQASQTLLERGDGYGVSQARETARVRALQHKLRSLGWQPGPVDGRFGPQTEAAVVRFQRNAGIAVDAIVGPQTRQALKRAATSPLRRGTGYAQPNGSPRVRVLQRQLRRHGFRPGPVDGVFGPRTEVALTRFQRHDSLPASGVVTERTARLLAQSEPVTQPAAKATKPTEPAAKAAKPAVQPVAAHRTTGTTGASDDTLDVPLMIGIGAAALLLGLALAVLIPRLGSGGRSSGTPAPAGAASERRPRLVPGPGALPVIGYASVRDAGRLGRAQLAEQEQAIAALCADRGWDLLEVASDSEEAADRGFARPGLQHALGRIGRGEVWCLVVSELGRLGGSAADISRVLESVQRAGGRLVAIDVGLDTASADAEVALNAISAVGVWDRAVEPVVKAEQPRVAALRRTRASTSQTTSDDTTRLRGRIATMRADGMTLQAIADRLNEEKVKTLGGSSTWRPSSVRYALTSGRRRTNGASPNEQAEEGAG
jgi:peptidoglycan hydrolase-like protein with peptidoglycan-binding domain/DNA invertase Pin-like site-specific DNA recombinase